MLKRSLRWWACFSSSEFSSFHIEPKPCSKQHKNLGHLGPGAQSIVSLTSSLRGYLVKCFTALLPNTLIFFVEKMREAFAVQKLLTFFQQKILAYIRYLHLRF